jgi:hypothetical protein
MYCFDPSEDLYKPTAFLGDIFMANFKFEKNLPQNALKNREKTRSSHKFKVVEPI